MALYPISLVAFIVISSLAVVSSRAYGGHFQAGCAQDPFGWFRHPSDCRRYIRCDRGVAKEMPSCPKGLVFSMRALACVWPQSIWDDCSVVAVSQSPPTTSTTAPQQLTVEQRCQLDKTAVFPHPTQCQLYYNCSNQRDPGFPSYFTKHMEECTYPQLFNSHSLRCENYTDVACGQREEHVDPCSYLRSQCVMSHCQPCSTRAESANCSGLADGMNVHEGRKWTPYYAVCKDQRTVGYGLCPRDAALGIAQFFSPDLGRCASLYEIPTQYGGYYLNCTQLADGLHPDHMTSRPNLYFRCQNGQLTNIDICPVGTFFESASSQCVAYGGHP